MSQTFSSAPKKASAGRRLWVKLKLIGSDWGDVIDLAFTAEMDIFPLTCQRTCQDRDRKPGPCDPETEDAVFGYLEDTGPVLV